MVWNVLWLAAMAAASALAGFCMGRLSGRTEESYEEDGRSERTGQRRHGAWEVEAVGEWNVKMESDNLETDDVQRVTGVRRMERSVREAEGERVRVGQHSYVGTTGWLSDRVIRGTGGSVRPVHRSRRARNQQTPEAQSWTVGSPVSGWVTSCREGEHPVVVIQPEEDKLYAPAAGKITRLFPMGNAFLFRTEFGTEVYLQVGNVGDDLLGRYFRPRVVQNEIVGKGKLLLEFDSQRLVAEGISPAVTVSVESQSYDNSVRAVAAEQVRAGEEILLVEEYQSMGSVR